VNATSIFKDGQHRFYLEMFAKLRETGFKLAFDF
jgi:hypothetical protein